MSSWGKYCHIYFTTIHDNFLILYNVIFIDLNDYRNISFPFIKIPEKSFLIIPEYPKSGAVGKSSVVQTGFQ